MALVTIRRSPSSSTENYEVDCATAHDEVDGDSNELLENQERSISECYFAVKGAALVLPQNECVHVYRKNNITNRGDIQQHLQSMFYLLRPEDTLKMAVKLESLHLGRTRYLVVVSCTGRQSTEESCLLGIDCNEGAAIGLVLPVWVDTQITLDGDGGFSVSSSMRHHIFKPVSVQAMWSALQTLHKASAKARLYNYYMGGLTHSWIEHYEQKIHTDRSCLNEWHVMDDLESRRPPSPDSLRSRPSEREATETYVRVKLKEIMMSVDLDEVTSKYIRSKLEEDMDRNLQDYKSFIDQEMIVILGQMDAATEIFDYLYLGSEWNASNLEELQRNGIRHIMNVTREIDNFFPGMFEYLNVRVYDEEGTELLRHWDKTYKFIDNAKKSGSKVLVHCKMGVSRSASVVIAYAMKAYNWSLQRALEFVKTKRTCIKPNCGFLKQLETYQGILDASKQRHNQLWRSKSETNLKSPQQQELGGMVQVDGHHHPHHHSQNGRQGLGLAASTGSSGASSDTSQPREISSLYLETPSPSHRPKSWSPEDNIVNMLFGNPPTGPSDPNGQDEIFLSTKRPGDDLSGSSKNEVVQTRNTHMLLPGRNGQAYCVSQNKVLHLPIRAEGSTKTPSPPILPQPEKVMFTIGDGDNDQPVFECRNPLYVEDVGDDEVLTQIETDLPIQRVSSIKDRINELEFHSQQGVVLQQGLVQQQQQQQQQGSQAVQQRGFREQLDLPEMKGLVLNLANQFESASKPNTPSPVEELESGVADPLMAVTSVTTTELEGSGPVLSQTKPPAPRHQAVLVKTVEMWDESNGRGKHVGKGEWQPGSVNQGAVEVKKRKDDLVMKLRVNGNQSQVVSPLDDVTLRRAVPATVVNDPFSVQVDHVFDREESVSSTSTSAGLDGRTRSPSRQNSWGSSDSAIVMTAKKNRESPSRQSSWGSTESRGNVPLSRDSSWGSVDTQNHSDIVGRRRPSVPDSVYSSPGIEPRFPPLFTESVIGKCNNKMAETMASPLKRTNSFDGTFTTPTELGGRLSPDAIIVSSSKSLISPIQRSQSLRMSNHPCAQNPQKSRVPNLNLHLHTPTPYRCRGDPPTVTEDRILHCASFPSLLWLRGGTSSPGYPTHATSQPNVDRYSPPGSSRRRRDLKLDLGSCICQPASVDDKSAQHQSGIVRQQRQALETRMIPVRNKDVGKMTSSSEAETLGKVKRLTKEIESKAGTSPPKKDKMVIVEQKMSDVPSIPALLERRLSSPTMVTESPAPPLPTSPPSLNGSHVTTVKDENDKSVRSLVGKFEKKDPHRTRYHSENDVDHSTSPDSDPSPSPSTSPNAAPGSTPRRKSVGFQSPPPSTWRESSTGGVGGGALCFSFTPKMSATNSTVPLTSKPPPPQCTAAAGIGNLVPRRVRMLHGKSHPLNKLMAKQRHPNALYNTM